MHFLFGVLILFYRIVFHLYWSGLVHSVLALKIICLGYCFVCARVLQPVFRHLAIGALGLQGKFNEESGNTPVPPVQELL